eukprot:SAG31_NODE_35606_length_321_cov_1.144144_2_plen_29_part_01
MKIIVLSIATVLKYGTGLPIKTQAYAFLI